ncbi:NAD(P)H-binding protein [Streptomyces platensis]|uniref:NAD(P)H-binding protein n=1 Tax=Streptomyces platensis TaxID=58346 RepID=UPI0036BF1A49
MVELLATGTAARALVRQPATAGLPEGVTVAGGDLSEPDTLEEALKGTSTVFLIWPFLLRRCWRALNRGPYRM